MKKDLGVWGFLATMVLAGLTSNIFAMEKADVSQSKVIIENESNWPIELTYKKRGKDLSMRLDSKKQLEIGRVGELSDVQYGTYGQYYGTAFSKKYPINLSKANPGKDLRVVISTWLSQWTEKYEDVGPEKGEPKPSLEEKDPWEVFSEAKKHYDSGDKQKAYRRIFSLGLKFTANDLDVAYKTLILKWHPDKNPGQEVYANKVSKIITEANEALKKEVAK